MKKSLLSLTLTVLIAFSALAQKTYTWDYYHIKLTVPSDFRVKTNTNHDFEMKGDGMALTMHIFEENVAIEDLDDVRVTDAGGSLRLDEEALAGLGVRLGGDELDRHEAREDRVLREEDGARRAAAQRPDDPVVVELRRRDEGGGSRRLSTLLVVSHAGRILRGEALVSLRFHPGARRPADAAVNCLTPPDPRRAARREAGR